MKTIILVIAVLALSGCTTTTTTTRGKEIVKVEKSGASFFEFFGQILGTALAGTASNFTTEHLRADPARVGLRK